MQGVEFWDHAVHSAIKNLPKNHRWAKSYAKASTDGSRQRIAEAVFYLANGIAGPTIRGPTAQIGCKLNLGAAAKEVAPNLTTSEAKRFISQEEYPNTSSWLWSEVVSNFPELKDAAAPGSIPVIRWVIKMMNSPNRRDALFKSRVNNFGETELEGSAIARLDELAEEDLRDSVDATLRASVERSVKEKWSGPDELIPKPRWVDNLPEGVILLRFASELFLEGSEMRHCAANYCTNVHNGSCLMWSVKSDKYRATVQTDLRGRILQITGFANKSAPNVCKKIASKLVGYIN